MQRVQFCYCFYSIGNMIYTILTRREMMVLRHRIAEVDPEAFINVIDSKEILGKGFKPLTEE